MKSTVRPTSEEIDRALIDVAALVFARHGFAQGPVQAIADGAGYSKAAVLKRFGSKGRIQDSVVARAEDMPHEWRLRVRASRQVSSGTPPCSAHWSS